MVTFTIDIPPMLAYMPAPWILWVMKIGEALDLSMPWCRDLEEPQVECRNATIATVSFSTSNQGARLWKSSKILGLEGHMNRHRGFLKWEHPNSWMVYSILMLILKNPWRSLFQMDDLGVALGNLQMCCPYPRGWSWWSPQRWRKSELDGENGERSLAKLSIIYIYMYDYTCR